MIAKALKTDSYLDTIQIQKHLKNVEYILMATPAPDEFVETPIHFTIFLNTSEELPQDVQDAVLDKFLDENKITGVAELMSQLMPVGFALNSNQDTPMPMLLVDPKDQKDIPFGAMHVMDFLADSTAFSESKKDNLTGWSYSYN